MLKINAILITCLFAFILIKPAIPYLDYMVRKSYIIEKFCINKDMPEMQCNGKCHLNEQIRENESSEEKFPFQPPVVQKEIQDYLIYDKLSGSELPKQPIQRPRYLKMYAFQFMPSVFHPPMHGSLPHNMALFPA